jgi:polyisoprenoid-binding protein YceI
MQRSFTPAHGPAPGLWLLDPVETVVTCSGRASRLAPTVRAQLAVVSGHVAIDDAARSELEVIVDVHSLTTGRASWDQILHSADPLKAATSPLATYRSHTVTWQAPGHAAVAGFLGLAGATHPLPLDVEFEYGDGGVRLSATGTLAHPTLSLPGLGYLVPRQFTVDIHAVAVAAA